MVAQLNYDLFANYQKTRQEEEEKEEEDLTPLTS